MLLCLDVGNTHMLGGVFEKGPRKDKPIFRFRYATSLLGSADQFGIFLISILKVHGLNPTEIEAVALSSVVPNYDYTLRHCFAQYFKKAQCFLLQPGIKTGLNIRCKNPNEVGADRIANAIGAIALFPEKPLIVVDMGTATTLCAIRANRDYLGGAILPGMRLCMEALKNNTAKLMAVNIEEPVSYIGKTTRESIQSGLYYGHLGALKELILGFKKEVFSGKKVKVIGTGGFSQLYEGKELFDILIPELVLLGLKKAFEYTSDH
ncbi:type III pantothenate kinase [Rickettsiella endosymbiont of Dermanyssus gallinae]|uniref:type III pantothenate kinase n=1 Tax=Rickettsiella endosymbiont of Dermanyssus gallinae TaxID=2856608 RepID=UPI001C52AD67|nr:type III pantothenate kinase [Rickettsiella endosymbiont of Dermanyssus gallinae]